MCKVVWRLGPTVNPSECDVVARASPMGRSLRQHHHRQTGACGTTPDPKQPKTPDTGGARAGLAGRSLRQAPETPSSPMAKAAWKNSTYYSSLGSLGAQADASKDRFTESPLWLCLLTTLPLSFCWIKKQEDQPDEQDVNVKKGRKKTEISSLPPHRPPPPLSLSLSAGY